MGELYYHVGVNLSAIKNNLKEITTPTRQEFTGYQLREEIADQIRALKGMKVMAESYGYDIS